METHILFFILAGILVAVLVGASIWSARREKSQVFSNTFSTRPPATPIQSSGLGNVPPTLDPQGLSSQGFSSQEMSHSVNNGNLANGVNEHQPLAGTPFAEAEKQEIENNVRNITIRLPGQEPVANEPQPVAQPYSYEPQAGGFAPTFANPSVGIAPEPMANPLANPIANPIANPTVEPVSVAVPKVELQSPEPISDHQPTINVQANEPASNEPTSNQQTDEPNIISLYVVAAEGQQFRGDIVVQQLEAVGLYYGDYQIFHRHLDIDSQSSPVLFSVANMLQPGVFDLSRIEQFSTVGLVFFMQLPSAGNDVANLKLMIRTVESFAQAVGGFVLDEQHQLFNDAARQAYLLRVSQN